MIKLVISWKYFEFIMNIPFIHVYLYYFIILLDVCVFYDIRFDTIHDTEKSKIDSRYDSWFDNYVYSNYYNDDVTYWFDPCGSLIATCNDMCF